MRLRNVPGSRDMIAESPFTIKDETEWKGRWNEVFGNDHPIHIEIGMGKGQFIMTLAKEHICVSESIGKAAGDGTAKHQVHSYGSREHCGSICTGRGGKNLPEFLRSMAKGSACQAASYVGTILAKI